MLACALHPGLHDDTFMKCIRAVISLHPGFHWIGDEWTSGSTVYFVGIGALKMSTLSDKSVIRCGGVLMLLCFRLNTPPITCPSLPKPHTVAGLGIWAGENPVPVLVMARTFHGLRPACCRVTRLHWGLFSNLCSCFWVVAASGSDSDLCISQRYSAIRVTGRFSLALAACRGR
jgi:hypothetical protein